MRRRSGQELDWLIESVAALPLLCSATGMINPPPKHIS